ncbi:MAG: SNF2-related protein, partial [Candidatus Taylorbacteria bacterium]
MEKNAFETSIDIYNQYDFTTETDFMNNRLFATFTQQDLIDQWQEEAQRVGINLQILNKRSAPIEHKGNYITHFEHIAKFSERYKDKFQCIILDEGHKIKSVNASRGRAIRSLEAKYKLVLTGTPVKNIAKDLHFIFGWLVGYNNEIYPYREHEQHKFRKDFGVYQIMDGHRNLIPEVSCIQELQYLISPIILRRDITELGIPMVKRNIYLVKVPFIPAQLEEYNTIESRYKIASLRIFNWQKNTVLFPGNKKVEVTIRLVNKILERQEQVIIFTGIMAVAKHLESIFKGSCEVANSLIPPPLRGELIKRFKKNEFPILIAGLE